MNNLLLRLYLPLLNRKGLDDTNADTGRGSAKVIGFVVFVTAFLAISALIVTISTGKFAEFKTFIGKISSFVLPTMN